MSEMNGIEQTRHTKVHGWMQGHGRTHAATRSRLFHWPASINRRRKHISWCVTQPKYHIRYLLFLTRISRERSLVLKIQLAAAAEETRSDSSSTAVGGTVSK